MCKDSEKKSKEIFTSQELADLSAEGSEPYVFCRDSQGNLTTKKKSK